jgi:hypothetical protein
MTTTYEKIATTTASGSVSTITFSSIPATYTDLVLIISGASSTTSGQALQFNSDTGSNYSRTLLYGNGSTAGSSRSSNQTSMGLGYMLSTGITSNIWIIQNYSNTTTYKTALCRADNANDSAQAGVGLWRSTAAINSISAICGFNYTNITTFTLYGIKAA